MTASFHPGPIVHRARPEERGGAPDHALRRAQRRLDGGTGVIPLAAGPHVELVPRGSLVMPLAPPAALDGRAPAQHGAAPKTPTPACVALW